MALTAAQEAFVVALFNKRDQIQALADYIAAVRLFETWLRNFRQKRVALSASTITQQQFDAWIAANPQPPVPNNPLDVDERG